VNSEEYERNLARLGKLAAAAREQLEQLGREIEALRSFIAELEAASEEAEATPSDSDEKAANRTSDPQIAQVEVVTK